MSYLRQNFADALLDADISAGASQITVKSSSLPTVAGKMILVIWDYVNFPNPGEDPNYEIVEAEYDSPNTYNITRAQEGSSAVIHSEGDRVGIHYTAGVSEDDLSVVGSIYIDETALAASKYLKVVDNAGTLELQYSDITGYEPTLSKGNLTAGSTKITIGGTGNSALIGPGATVDVNEGNINHNSLLNVHQDVNTNASPTFANLYDSGLTSGRVTYAGTAGLLQNSANLTFDGTNLTCNGDIYYNGYLSSITDYATTGIAGNAILRHTFTGAGTTLGYSVQSTVDYDQTGAGTSRFMGYYGNARFGPVDGASTHLGDLNWLFGVYGACTLRWNQTSSGGIYPKITVGAGCAGVLSMTSRAAGETVDDTAYFYGTNLTAWCASGKVARANGILLAEISQPGSNNYGVRVVGVNSGVDAYGLYVGDCSGSGNAYAIYTNTGNVHLGDTLGVTGLSTLTGGAVIGTAASDPQDATPANRPAGTVAQIMYYGGKMYFCTNSATPTWEIITSA